MNVVKRKHTLDSVDIRDYILGKRNRETLKILFDFAKRKKVDSGILKLVNYRCTTLYRA